MHSQGFEPRSDCPQGPHLHYDCSSLNESGRPRSCGPYCCVMFQDNADFVEADDRSCVPWSLCQETESGTGPRWGQGLERQERHVGHTGVRMQQGELQRCPRQVRKAPELSRLFLKSKMPILRKGTELFSNYTREFSKTHTHTNEDAAEDPS